MASGGGSEAEDAVELRKRQADEIAALRAIFGEDEMEVDGPVEKLAEVKDAAEAAALGMLEVRIFLGQYTARQRGGVSVPARLVVKVPPLYPRQSGLWSVSCAAMSTEKKGAIFAAIEAATRDLKGSECIMSAAMAAKEVVATRSREDVDMGPCGPEMVVPEFVRMRGGPGAVPMPVMEVVEVREAGVPAPPIHHGPSIVEKKSEFVAHAARVHSREEVAAVMAELMRDKKVARATHNIMAYRIWDPERQRWLSDNDEDGESAAGGRLAQMVELMGARDVVVVVSRWYGGVELGPRRFAIINNCAQALLLSSGLVSPSDRSA
jgi:Uncharacterized protein family UPF0029